MEGETDGLDPDKGYLYKQRAIFYATASLWDILIDSSNVMEDDFDTSLLLQEKRIASMICNIDDLLKLFTEFIGEICSNNGISETANESTSISRDVKDTPKLEGSVQLTERLALVMHISERKLQITNPKRIDSEFEKCEVRVNSLLELIGTNEYESRDNSYPSAYEEMDPKQTQHQMLFDGSESLSIKPEEKELLATQLNLWNNGEKNENIDLMGRNIPLYSDEVPFEPDLNIDKSMIYSYTRKPSRKKSRKAGRPRGSKMKPSDSMVGRFRRLGYYPDYCVSEEVYKEAIEKGSPYCCPLCQKRYKERRSLEKHFAGTVNNKCPGVPVEKPTYKLENGRYYCTQPGCEHEIATHGAKSMGVIWTHHQSEHLSKDANLPFNCDQCPKSFPLHSILASHIASTHDLKKCSQICDVCGKTIAGSKNKIKQHMLVHTGEKIKCSQCDITFSRPGSLRRHMQHQHNVSNLHFCDICGKTWNTRSALNDHRESHKTESGENQQQRECQFAAENYIQENR